MASDNSDQVIRFKKLYELSMELSGDPIDIFVKAARIIAEIMDVKVVCLSEIRGSDLFFLCVYVQGNIHINAGGCPLDITPCATVQENKAICVYQNVIEHFPKADFLKEHNAYSYCGFPSLGNNGEVVAVTCLLDDRTREFSVEDQELLRIFGQRIGHEIERKSLDEERQAAIASHTLIKEGLERERNLLRRTLDGLFIFVALLDASGKIIEANRAPFVAAGIRREDYIGIQFGDSFSWAYDPQVHARAKSAVIHAQQGETVRFDVPLKMAKGIIMIDFSIAPVFDEQGGVTQIVASGVDISERKKVEDALRYSEERLEMAIQGAELGLWEWDIQTGTVALSKRWSSMLGYPHEMKMSCFEAWEALVHPEDLSDTLAALDAHLDGKTPFFEAEYRAITKSKEWKWILGRGKVVAHDADGKPLRAIGIDMDISPRKDLELRLHQRQEELYYAQRLTSAGELAAMVSHELNQPLGSINNYIGGALLRFHELLSANPALNEVLEQTLRVSQRAIAVVHGIRALVRKQKGKREFVSLREVVEDIVIPLRTDLSNKQIKINLGIAPTLPQIWCERIHLQQLFLNLIINAIQAMDTKECIQRKLSLDARLNANHKLEIMITDTGPGIAPEVASRLFEPFVSTKPEGIGLGLSISRTITEALGGRISVQSMTGLGTTFLVVLPPGEEGG